MKCKCRYPDVFVIRGAVIQRIWPQVLFCTLYAAIMVAVNLYYEPFLAEYKLPDSMLAVLGMVTGMLLVFRTNTANDRYYEARKVWSDMSSCIRSLTRTFWIFIDTKNSPKLIVEKISAVNLLVAFAYATKHYLREEYDYDEDDLMEFAGYLPHLLTPTSLVPLENQEGLRRTFDPAGRREREKRSSNERKIKSMKDSLPEMRRHANVMKKVYDEDAFGTNIPLEITFYLSSYILSCRERELMDHPTCRIVDTAVEKLVHCLTAFERIRGSPIPFAYRVHLTHIIWIGLLLLPFRFASTLLWLNVPLMTLTSFSMLGILDIGKEIEEPFGYDYNDLNLDEFCYIIHKEALAIISVQLPPHDAWMFSEDNRPLPNNPRITAPQLVQQSVAEIHRLLYLGSSYELTGNKMLNRKNPVVMSPPRGNETPKRAVLSDLSMNEYNMNNKAV